MRLLPCILLLATISTLATAAPSDRDTIGGAVIGEMNRARQNPSAYAAYLEDLRSNFNGKYLVLPGHTKIYTREGLGAVDEAIRFLRTTQPLQPLTLSRGMCRGAADHCAEQAGGAIGHDGRGWSNPASRMNRYGNWAASWGENIAYGKTNARDIVMALIIDDGLPARKHRANIFAAKFNYAGAAYGQHARYGSVCSIDFAGAYFERGQSQNSTLVAKNY